MSAIFEPGGAGPLGRDHGCAERALGCAARSKLGAGRRSQEAAKDLGGTTRTRVLDGRRDRREQEAAARVE